MIMCVQNLIGWGVYTALLLVAQNATVNGKHGVISTCFKISNKVNDFMKFLGSGKNGYLELTRVDQN